MLKEAEFNKNDNFIAGWFIDETVCDSLINYFENSPQKAAGTIINNGVSEVDKNTKLSTDLSIDPNTEDKIIQDYYTELAKVCNNYIDKYKYCSKNHDGWTVTDNWNIQKYEPNEGFFEIHCERAGRATANRHLVFMTYLNTVDDGGETEFIYQKMKVKPQKGLTLIWGTDWTFMHRGIASPTQTKYITTGWYEYI